jgi:hypothetical protein
LEPTYTLRSGVHPKRHARAGTGHVDLYLMPDLLVEPRPTPVKCELDQVGVLFAFAGEGGGSEGERERHVTLQMRLSAERSRLPCSKFYQEK